MTGSTMSVPRAVVRGKKRITCQRNVAAPMAPFKPAFRINPFPCPPDVSFFKSGHPFNMNLILQMQELCLTTVGLVFLWSGVAKLAASGDFKTTLWQIPHLPAGLVPAIHWLLPPVEIGIAVGLVWGLTAAKLAATGLLTTFCLLAFVVMQARLKVHCSCFGSGNRVFSGWTIAQNLFLIGLVGLGTPVVTPLVQGLIAPYTPGSRP